MLNRQTYENFWDIFSSIPSLEHEGMSVTEEILNFSEENLCYAKARFLDDDGEIMDCSSYGLSKAEMLQLVNLWKSEENELDDITIEEWFDEAFFKSVFLVQLCSDICISAMEQCDGISPLYTSLLAFDLASYELQGRYYDAS